MNFLLPLHDRWCSSSVLFQSKLLFHAYLVFYRQNMNKNVLPPHRRKTFWREVEKRKQKTSQHKPQCTRDSFPVFQAPLLRQDANSFACISAARDQPKTSKSITELSLKEKATKTLSEKKSLSLKRNQKIFPRCARLD